MNNKNSNEFTGNGWTKYQKLVLAELKRHEETLNSIMKDLNSIQISMTNLKSQLGYNQDSINNLVSDNKALDKARETQNIDLKAIQWKITTFSMVASGAVAVAVEILMRFFNK